MLVPAVAAGAAGELDGLRAACDEAVARVLRCDPQLLAVVGAAPRTGALSGPAAADLAPYGLPLPLGGGPGPERLPLAHAIGTWLLEWAGNLGPRLLIGVRPDCAPTGCAALGAALAGRAERVGLLVMGDGSARRRAKAPGYLDPRARRYDDAAAGGRVGAELLARQDPYGMAYFVASWLAGPAST